jgi:hypothetical protein
MYTCTHTHTHTHTQKQTLGMAESIGDALASGCLDYIIAGSLCLFLLIGAWLIVVCILAKGMMESRAIFQPVPGSLFARLKQALSAKGDTWYGSLTAKKAALEEMYVRGEWEDPHEETPVCLSCLVCLSYINVVYVCMCCEWRLL